MPVALRILARNMVDEYTSLYAVPALLATLPETNLARATERGRTARTSSLAAQEVNVEWSGAGAAVNVVAVTRTNMTTAGTIQTRRYLVGSPSTLQDDSGALAAFSTMGLDTNLDDYTASYFAGLRNFVYYPPSLATLSQLKLNYVDAANSAGYVDWTRLWAGRYATVTYDPPYGGIDLQPFDASKQSRAEDGTMLVDRGWRARKFRMNLEFIPDSDLPTMLALANRIGVFGECFIDFYPGNGDAKQLYHCGAFRLTDSPTFNPHQVGLHRNTMMFEET